MERDASGSVGRVIGTEDSTPLEFWVAVGPGEYLQLDDVVACERAVPGQDAVSIYGVVSQVRARHEGARFDSDVFEIVDARLPGEVSEAAQVTSTRFNPEIFVPPTPGSEVRRAAGKERDTALFFDDMEAKLPAGLSRDGEPIWVGLEFLDGSRGAHVNISGISGVATKTTYATFLLYSLFHSGALGADAVNTKALVFNVKGEDLLFLDHANNALPLEESERYALLGLPVGPFGSVAVFAPPRRGSAAGVPDVASRPTGVTSFFWTLAEFCREELLPFLFADAEDDRQQYTIVVQSVVTHLTREAQPLPDGGVRFHDPHTDESVSIRTFRDLVEFVNAKVEDEDSGWAGRAISSGTVGAFVRRLNAAVRHVEHLIRGDVPNAASHRVSLDRQVTVVDLHNLNDRAKRFVVGVVVRREFERKEQTGTSRPLLFLVLDELNKYAPREGSSPIKEMLLDVAERGRSLGVILIGAEQTASEVERRVIANSAVRVVGRLDSAEAVRDEYGFLPGTLRQRTTILKPGSMVLSQPQIPVPLLAEFPFPAWATRASEAGGIPGAHGSGDPFDGMPR
ncbi:MAG: ATP-binding protein [Actinomycetota bacterium]